MPSENWSLIDQGVFSNPEILSAKDYRPRGIVGDIAIAEIIIENRLASSKDIGPARIIRTGAGIFPECPHHDISQAIAVNVGNS